MKALKVTYSRLISKGNFENVKIEIEVEVAENESAAEVFKAAKNWVENRIAAERITPYQIDQAKTILADRRNNTGAKVEEAEEIISILEVEDDLPF